MVLAAQNFDPLTFAQANPFLTGFGAGQQIINQGLLNQKQQLENKIQQVAAQFAQPEAQQELLKAQLNNQILQPQAQYAPQMTLAELALKRTMPNYYNALAGQAGSNAALLAAHANLLRQTTPYDVQKAQADVYSDPLFSKANQAAMINRAAQNNPQLAAVLGQLNQPMGQGQPSQQSAIPFANGMSIPQTNMPSQGSAMQNYLLYGNPLGPFYQQQLQAYGKGLETQQTQQAKDWSNNLISANKNATIGNNIVNAIDQFKTNYDKSKETGAALGNLPAVSSAAQLVDTASAKLQGLEAQNLPSNRTGIGVINFIGKQKPSRSMNPQAAQTSYDFWKENGIRSIEEQQFKNAAKYQGVDPYTANSLWSNYNNQRPWYDFDSNKPNTQYRGTWNDYLTPKAIQSVQTGQKYTPPLSNPATRRVRVISPDGKTGSISANKLDQALSLGYKEVQ